MKRSVVMGLAVLLAGTIVLTGCCPPGTGPAARGGPAAWERDRAPARAELARGEGDDSGVLFYDRPDHSLVRQAIPTGDRASSVILLEKTGPEEVIVGSEFEYRVRVTNISDLPLTNVRLIERVQPEFEILAANPAPQSRGNELMWEMGRLEPGQSRMVSVQTVATAIGSLEACSEVVYDPPELCLTVQAVQPMIQVAKLGPEQVLLCDEIVYRILISNTGTGIARNIRILDPLADGLLTAEGQPQAAFSLDQLAPGESREFTFRALAQEPGQYTNQVRVAADGFTVESAPISTLVAVPVLAIAKTAPGATYAGVPTTFTIVVENQGNGPAMDAVLLERLSPNAELMEATGNPRRTDEGLAWDLGTIEPGGRREVQVTVRPTAPGQVENIATARAYCAEDVFAAAMVDIVGIPALLLEVVDLEDPVAIGQTTTYVIAVTNQGSAPARDVRVSVDVPEQQEFVAAQAPMALQADGQRVEFAPVQALPPGETLTIRVVTRATQPGDSRFRVTLNSADLEQAVGELENTTIFDPVQLQRETSPQPPQPQQRTTPPGSGPQAAPQGPPAQ